MDIASATAARTSGSAAAASAEKPGAAKQGSMIASDFETFLTMLTTQMENQDPLKPIESTDFAVQLATFSGVEQQVRTNNLLAAMQSQLGASGISQYASWVGMEVRATATAMFSDSPITLYPEPASGAERAMVVVRDPASGEDIDRFEVPVSDAPVQWAGVDGDGNPFPEGKYTFHLQSIKNDTTFSEEQIAVFSEVQELRMADGEIRLVLAGGDEVAASDVTAVRKPEDP